MEAAWGWPASPWDAENDWGHWQCGIHSEGYLLIVEHVQDLPVQGSRNCTFAGGSNLMQMYDDFEGFPL